jgi:hypothetical protein
MRHGWLRRAASIGVVAIGCSVSAAYAQTAPSLGSAQPFGVLAGSAVTNTGPTVINGELGISPSGAGSISGFPPGTATGATHAADGVALNAQNDMTTAYNSLFAQPCTTSYGPGNQDLTGLTLTPGVYCFASSASITGTVTLNALGNPNAVFIFLTGTAGASSLTTGPGSTVQLINGTQACNVFWAISSSATIDTTSTFVGNILAQASITVNNGAHLFGRALAKAAVTLINDVIDATVCSGIAAGGGCPPGAIGPTITTIPSQVIPTVPVNGSVAVGFSISGSVIADALVVSATSADQTLVPTSAMTITRGAGGARVLTIFGADGRSGVTTITVTVRDPINGCETSRSFSLTVGTGVPTLPQIFVVFLALGLVAVGYVRLRQRARAT